MRIYLLVALVALLSTFLLSPLVRAIAIRFGAITPLRDRDSHKEPTPRMGGLSMCLGFIFAMFYAYTIPYLANVFEYNTQVLWIVIGAVLIAVLGVLDDLFEIDWTLKLAGQILIGVLVAINGVQLFSLPLWGLIVGSPLASVTVTTFIIVALTNATNFIDGLDGLLAGTILIGSSAFYIYSYSLSSQFTSYASLVSIITVATIGICAGFLFINFAPARIFMGDTGSMLLGFLTACSSILVTGRIDPAATSIETLPAYMPILLPVLMFLLPCIDMLLAVIRRVLRRKSPFEPDRMHLHHRIVDIGHSKRAAVLLLYSWTGLFAYSALLLVFIPQQDVLLIFIIGIAVLLVLTFLLGGIVDKFKRTDLYKKFSKEEISV
ncbi:MAG: undecaprenyl/decaprenyl-phosphate alpha-N-acetylglucosaminyl 1-phosphate transferase [Bifidobacteriaceae bacterium]|jgi:UDP-GlcNAc:undecaprenyl-phosphate GlcNAc-1-phosphate transferase|nr:undecaprenyl/decaprenyl-phosphate alpha-N-acetylglucosaminyl 1-phosphate transferase [Bifidobacteriaceae bacterium]